MLSGSYETLLASVNVEAEMGVWSPLHVVEESPLAVQGFKLHACICFLFVLVFLIFKQSYIGILQKQLHELGGSTFSNNTRLLLLFFRFL